MNLISNTQIVAAIQFDPKLFDVRRNLAEALQLTFEAAAKGARVIVLPELCTSGFVINDKREAMKVAQTRDGYQTECFYPIAQRFNCHIVFGYIELNEGKLYNSASVIGPYGLEATTQKHNLSGADNLWAEASESLSPIVMTGAGRLGILICRDALNKYRESYQFASSEQKFYRRGSVDTIALLTNWGHEYMYPDSAWVDLVESTSSNLVVSNRVGVERDVKFKGGSCVIDRNKRVWTHGSNFDGSAVVGGVVLL